MEDEIPDVLRRAAEEEALLSGGLGTEIAGMFGKIGLEAEIPELRGETCQELRGEDAHRSMD
jgi:hypothetical protein